MTDIDYDKVLFSTLYPIDKVLETGDLTHTVAAPSAAFYNNSDRLEGVTITNPTGKDCLVRYVWSIDNINFNSSDTVLQYSFSIDASALGGPASSPGQPGTKAVCAVGVKAADIQFLFLNGYHGNVTYTFGNDVFTGFPLTFFVKYALFEIT